MSIVQSFYDNMATQYDKLFLDWQSTTREQASILDKIFRDNGFSKSSHILDCACGIGTQTIGLAELGYQLTGSDISTEELKEATARAKERQLSVAFKEADFTALSAVFKEETFDIIIAMDNALPHMLSYESLNDAVESIIGQLTDGGMFVASIRDYDALLETKPSYSPPYIHKTEQGQRVSFQTWNWHGDCYDLVQYILEDGANLCASKYQCTYRATRRNELTDLLYANGCSKVAWLFPEESSFYQPIVIGRK